VSFRDAVEVLAPWASHLHLVDAVGDDGEGLQIGEGDIDWAVLCEQLNRLAPGVPFIPEIWQGHVGGGQGFWTALDRLEPLLTKPLASVDTSVRATRPDSHARPGQSAAASENPTTDRRRPRT
jgi:hypothetical protein